MSDANVDSQAYRGYMEGRVLSAHPVEIVHLLYQVAIDNLNVAIACLKTDDHFGRSRAVTKAQKAVHELMFALDPAVNAPSTRNLTELYDYVQRQIIAGHTRRSQQAFEYALAVLTTLSEGWSGVKAQVMGDNKAAGAKLQNPAEEQSEANREKELSHLYAEPPKDDPTTARDWSC
jgi:flagellar biosynthetic protein FliS